MSLAKRLIRSLRVGKEKFFVGTDLEGTQLIGHVTDVIPS